jgi:hypothetical protein
LKSEKARPQLLPGQCSDSALFGFRESREKKKQICRKFVLILILIVSDVRIQKFPLAELNTALWFSVCSPSLSLWFLGGRSRTPLTLSFILSRFYYLFLSKKRFYYLCIFPSLILSFLGNQTKGERLYFFLCYFVI